MIEYGSKISLKVVKFKLNLIQNVNKLIPNPEILSSHDLNIILMNSKSIDLTYPCIG